MQMLDFSTVSRRRFEDGGGGRGTLYNDIYGEAVPERGTFFRGQVCQRVGNSRIEVYERVGISIISVLKRRALWRGTIFQRKVYETVNF